MKPAIVYARRGYRVLPLHDVTAGHCSCSKGAACSCPGKHPRINDWASLASASIATVEGWIAKYPTANIGLATGEGSGVFVLDVDPDNGGDATLAALIAKHGPLSETAVQRTGSGGTHYVFAWPGFNVTNSAGKLGKGLDIRGNGGQVVVAPSVSARGPYKWVNAPWDVKPAPAPEWLLTMLRPAAKPKAPALPAGFIRATPEVLASARAALAEHGPAIEGNGGDQHTFVAASILSHDFALSEDEAMPLFREWNETCEPPWSETDLLTKFRGGLKYGTGAFGAKRSAEAFDTALRLVDEAKSRGVLNPTTVYAEIERFRFNAPERDSIIHACKVAFKGKGPKLAAPIAPLQLEDGEIEVSPRLAELADTSTLAMADEVYERAGILCEVVDYGRTVISEMEAPRIQDVMSRSATFVRNDPEKGKIEVPAPERIATIIASRRTHPKGTRRLLFVAESPIFLADGTILQKEGYDEGSKVYLKPSVLVNVPDTPTRDDASSALATLHDVFFDVPFLEPADRDVLIAAILTPLVKTATENAPAPLFVVSASSPGAGKTLMTDVVSRITYGRPAEVRPHTPNDENDWTKRITSYVKAGATANVFDNVNGLFGDPALDRLITAPAWSDRILGASEAPPLPNVGLWFVTGNNCEPEGDTIRRCAMCRIDVRVDRPSDRSGFRHASLADWAQKQRKGLLGAALTILRAWYVGGRFDAQLPAWGSFDAWGRIVRNAIVWAGGIDPWQTQKRLQADATEPENEVHEFWLRIIAATDHTPQSICASANASNARQMLNARDEVTPHSLRKFLHRFIDKPHHGKRIRRLAGGGFSVDVV